MGQERVQIQGYPQSKLVTPSEAPGQVSRTQSRVLSVPPGCLPCPQLEGPGCRDKLSNDGIKPLSHRVLQVSGGYGSSAVPNHGGKVGILRVKSPQSQGCSDPGIKGQSHNRKPFATRMLPAPPPGCNRRQVCSGHRCLVC